MNANRVFFTSAESVTALRSLIRAGSLAVIAGLIAACQGTPFGTCKVRTVELTMPATWSFAGQTMTSDWFTQLVEMQLDPALFHPIADAFANAGTGDGQMSWILPAFDTNGGMIGLRVPRPLQVGEVIPVGGVAPAGGFAVFAARGEGAWVDIRIDDFRATEAEGQLEVESVSPLSVRVDLSAIDESERMVTVAGVMAFRVFEQETSCF